MKHIKQTCLPISYVEGFVKLTCTNLLRILLKNFGKNLGHSGTIAYEAWPAYDEAKLMDDEVEIVIQINGKVKHKLMVPIRYK